MMSGIFKTPAQSPLPGFFLGKIAAVPDGYVTAFLYPSCGQGVVDLFAGRVKRSVPVS